MTSQTEAWEMSITEPEALGETSDDDAPAATAADPPTPPRRAIADAPNGAAVLPGNGDAESLAGDGNDGGDTACGTGVSATLGSVINLVTESEPDDGDPGVLSTRVKLAAILPQESPRCLPTHSAVTTTMALTSVWAVQKALPPIDADITETETRVGGFTVLWKLGKGVFGAVKACRARDGSKEELALKTIPKKNVRANPFHRRALSRRASRRRARRSPRATSSIRRARSCASTARSTRCAR